jgi:hypothetical protein
MKMRQRLLTLVFGTVGGSIPELREGLILLEALGERFCTLISDLVRDETANRRAAKVSAAADSRNWGVWWRTPGSAALSLL